MDWDKAYDNRTSVPEFPEYLERWTNQASAFRESISKTGRCEFSLSYGPHERNVVDLFLPEEDPKGLIVYVHGGYWRALDKSYWSHLAKAALNEGWAVGIPSYTLAPLARITQIVEEIRSAIEFLSTRIAGEIRLIGHSAGGHLVARMLCEDVSLAQNCAERITHTVAVSGVFDLEHLPKTEMNNDLQIDDHEITTQSPARLAPRSGVSITCIVGENELPEFRRQNELLRDWRKHGAKVEIETSKDTQHFSVIEPLEQLGSQLTNALLLGANHT